MKPATRPEITCGCEVCGKEAKCSRDEAGPPGWYYHPVKGQDPVFDGCALLCSKECIAKYWRPTTAYRRPR